jgi:transposase
MMRAGMNVRVFVCPQPADMRRSFDGLSGMVRELIAQDPLSGHLFVFRNRGRDRLKLLWWDGDGLAIFYRRLEQGSFQLPTDLRSHDEMTGETAGVEITADELSLLLAGIDLRSVTRRRRYTLPQEVVC